MSSREAILTLSLLPDIGPIRVQHLLKAFGSAESVLRVSRAQLAAVPGLGDKCVSAVARWRELADAVAEEERCTAAGVRIVTLVDPEYPAALKQIHDPPLCLYVRGQVAALTACSERGIAVVGTRHPSYYGQSMAATLSASAVAAGWVVVSGLARGIDTAAHAAVVKAGGATVAVTAGGLAHIYPEENMELARAIAEHGAVISEQPLLMPPDKRFFPMRNRIIAGLSRGTIVVEAGGHSGALITADLAGEQGRQVFAVPGRVDTPQAQGCHRLLRQGAVLTETFDDVLEDFGYLPGVPQRPKFGKANAPLPATGKAAPAPPAGNRGASTATQAELFEAPASAPPALATLGPLETQLIACLRDGEELGVDQLVELTRAPVSTVLTALLGLELKRLVKQRPGRCYVLAFQSKGG